MEVLEAIEMLLEKNVSPDEIVSRLLQKKGKDSQRISKNLDHKRADRFHKNLKKALGQDQDEPVMKVRPSKKPFKRGPIKLPAPSSRSAVLPKPSGTSSRPEVSPLSKYGTVPIQASKKPSIESVISEVLGFQNVS